MAFSEETYAVLNKKLASVTSGIATYEIVGNQLVMTTTDGQTLTYTFTQPKDGVGIDDISISGSGNTRTLTFTMTDGTTKTVDIPVVKGDKGDKGDGISTMQVVDNHLIVTLTDGTEIDCGLIDVTTSMANLEDVDVSTVENGQILIYDSTTNTWKNGSPSATSTSLDDLSNVNIDTITLQNGQIIKYDAVNQVWVNADSINIESLNDINDVNIVNIQDGQVIAYDSTNQKWVNTNAIAKLRDMTDVELTNLSELNMLRYDSVNNKWVNFDADTTVTDGSTNVVTSGAVYTELQNKSDKATTLSGYGITDSYTKTEEDTLLNAKADKSTTLDGYGITDAYTKTETDTLLDGKVDKNGTDSLMTQAEHTKLEGIESGAEVNVQANWNQTDTEADNYIQNKPTLGTASEKNYTNYVSPTSSDLVISSSVYSAIDSAVSSVYEPYGNLTCAELTQDLLVQENVGHVYNITDSGTTTNLFIGGAGQTINPSDGVVIVRNGESFAYNLIGQLINLTAYQKKELDTPLEIGGTTQTNLESALGALSTEKADKATTLSGYGIINAYTKSETDTKITNAINDLDVTDEYVSNQFISSVSETNGKIDVTRQQLSTTPTLDVYTPISSHGVKKALNSEITPINDKIGNTSISTIGDGTITNAISELDSNLKNNTRTNLLNPTAQTQTVRGVTFTNNGDGTYTVNGTASTQAYILATSSPVDLIPFRNKDIRIAGCPTGGGANKYQFNLIISDASDGDIARVIDYGEGSTYHVPSNADHAYVVIAVQNGTTCNNLLFKPMLTTDLNATYDDFVRYSGAGKLNENVAEIYKVSDRVSDETYTNLLNPTAQTQTINGVTFTNNGDGTYTVNGTASGVTYFPLADPFTDLDLSREYKIVGCPQGGSYDSRYALKDDENAIYDIGNGAIYTPANQPKLYIRIGGNTTCNNLLFKPMLTTDLSATYNDFVQYSGNGKLNENVAEIYKVSERVSDETYTNLLNPIGQTTTVNGVTFTNNGDGTYTVNGTASGGDAHFGLRYFTNISSFENTKLVGCPIGGSSLSYYMVFNCYNGSTWFKGYLDTGNGILISNIPSETTEIRFVITVKNGQTANNLLFKPMITTKLDATYDDYIPYSGSGALNENVAEIYGNKQDKTDNALTTTDKTIVGAIDEVNEKADNITNGTCANLLNPTAQTETRNGITLTNNGDGTYTVNGTAKQTTLFNVQVIQDNFDTLKNTKIVGCPIGGSWSTYILYVACYNGSSLAKDYGDAGNGKNITDIPSGVNRINITIIVYDGTTVNNLLFKPMVTTDLNAKYDDYVPYTGDSGRLNEDVSQIISDLSDIKTGNVTWNTTNKTSGTATLIKIGRICQLTLNQVTYSSITNGTTIFTVPNEFKPINRAWIPIVQVSSTLDATSDWTTFPVVLETDGNAIIYSTSGSASARLSSAKATITYISAS